MLPGLFSYLVNTYCPSQGNRSAAPLEGHCLKIDDQNASDSYPGFCQINATFPNPEASTFTLKMLNAPYNPEVQVLIESRGGEVKPSDPAVIITITLSKNDIPFIRKFAKAIGRVIGRGRRYPDPCWKWICPRTADALERLASHIATYRRTATPATRR